jgi:formyltetrahydrofolate-dependent phosphoribosylglycinamide formyltransferase
MKNLVVFASGNGTNLQAIMDACTQGVLPARVVAVISDRKAARALDRARLCGIPALYHPWLPYKVQGCTRQEYDADLARLASVYRPDWIVLAGWLRVSMVFLRQFPGRVVNLHPALPGAFPGLHAIERAYAAWQRGEIEHTGVMVHLVPDEGVDVGPVVAQEIIPIRPGDSLEQLEARIHAVEHRLFVAALAHLLG